MVLAVVQWSAARVQAASRNGLTAVWSSAKGPCWVGTAPDSPTPNSKPHKFLGTKGTLEDFWSISPNRDHSSRRRGSEFLGSFGPLRIIGCVLPWGGCFPQL